MTAATVQYPGQINNAGDTQALFYKLFTGEVLAAFDAKNVMMNRHRIRNLRGGKSASFANTGKAYGKVHAPGTEILGSVLPHNETVISVDDLIISDVFIPEIEEAKNHYEVRRDYSKQCGEALARTFDKQVMRVAASAARSANKITGLPGGETLTLSAGYAAATDAAKAVEFAEALFAARQGFDEDDVDTSGAFVLVRPVDYYRLVRNKDLLNKDWGGVGSYAQAELPMVAGFPLVMTNHIPAQNDLVGNDAADAINVDDNGDIVTVKYALDYTKLQSLILTPDFGGTVKLIDLSVRGEWDHRRQGTLIVAKQATGHGVLRPECAKEIVLP